MTLQHEWMIQLRKPGRLPPELYPCIPQSWLCLYSFSPFCLPSARAQSEWLYSARKLWTLVLILALLKPQLHFFYKLTKGNRTLEAQGFKSMQIKITGLMDVSENYFFLRYCKNSALTSNQERLGLPPLTFSLFIIIFVLQKNKTKHLYWLFQVFSSINLLCGFYSLITSSSYLYSVCL